MMEAERRRKIAELTEKEELIRIQLREVISQRNHIEAKLRSIHKIFPKLEIIQKDARDIAETINRAASLSDSVTVKISQLDKARNRVSECQDRLNELIDLQVCSDGVQLALKDKDYEKAAGHIHRFLSMDQRRLHQTANDVSENINSIAKSVNTLQDAATELNSVIKLKFDEAAKNEDLASVERFFKIFPLLELHEEGLHKFSKYLCSKVQETSLKNLETALKTSVQDKRSSVIYADTLTLLFEGIARIIEVHNPLLESYYGPGHLLTLVLTLQKECDEQTKMIYNEFIKRRQVKKKMNQINESFKLANSYKNVPEKMDPKSLDVIITELSIMHARAELYIRFLRRRVLSDLDFVPPDIKPMKIVELNSILTKSDLSQCMHELIANYLLFERYFMEESVKKAVAMDILEDGQQTSSMVDDIFFIIRKCIRRAISSGSLEGICAVVNNASEILDRNFCLVLKEQLQQGYPSGYLDLTQAYNVLQTSIQQGRLQSGGDFDQARITFIVYLNNADVGSEYVDTLCSSLLEEVIAALPSMTDHDRDKLEIRLSELSSITPNLKKIIDFGMQQLRASAIKPRVNPWVDEFLNVLHELTEDELSDYEARETFIQTLIMNLESLLNSFRNLLTTSNFDTLVGVLTADVTSRMEKVIFKSRFNRLGGLILDKEVRGLASYLTSATSWSIRDKFTRLTQIATILNLENVSEISDYEGSNSGGFTWRLTPIELRQVISLRTDFSPDELHKLKI